MHRRENKEHDTPADNCSFDGSLQLCSASCRVKKTLDPFPASRILNTDFFSTFFFWLLSGKRTSYYLVSTSH